MDRTRPDETFDDVEVIQVPPVRIEVGTRVGRDKDLLYQDDSSRIRWLKIPAMLPLSCH
jgi:hypothetical protein